MPQAEPIWEMHREADDMVKALIQMYPEKLGHIVDPDIIGCAAIGGKDKPESQTWDAQIEGIKEPPALWSKKIYCIKFYKSTWDQYSPAQREHMLLRLLVRIPDETNGKVLAYDLQDCYFLVKEYGPDYMKDPLLPDLLKDKKTFLQGKAEKEAAEA